MHRGQHGPGNPLRRSVPLGPGAVMRLTRQILIQLAIFAVIATTALAIMVFGYIRLPAAGRHRAVPRDRGVARDRRVVSRATSPTAASRSAR